MVTFFKLGLLFFFIFYLLLMILQSKRVIIHQYTSVFEKFLAIILLFSTLTFVTYIEPSFLNYSLVVLGFIIMIFGNLVLGITDKGIIAMTEGGHPKGLLSDEISYSHTRDWLIHEKKQKLKIRITVDSAKPTLRYLYLPIDKKAELMKQLAHHNISFSIK